MPLNNPQTSWVPFSVTQEAPYSAQGGKDLEVSSSAAGLGPILQLTPLSAKRNLFPGQDPTGRTGKAGFMNVKIPKLLHLLCVSWNLFPFSSVILRLILD